MNPLESENDRHTEQLTAKVARLKNIAIDIDNETKEHNRFLESMRFDFDTGRSFLSGSARHLSNVMSSGRSDRRFMCYIIVGIVFGFLFLFYVVSSFRNDMVRNRLNHPKTDQSSSPEIKSKQARLYSFETIPEYLQSNPYIRTGYRYGLNFKDCLISLLYLNNESVNVWSHLVGVVLFLYFLFRDIYTGQALPFLSSTSDYYFVLFYSCTVIICMFCSVLFHLFGCISSRVFADFLKLDLCGIGFGILGCYLCGLHLSFECYRDWRIRYELLIVSVMFIAVIYYVHGVKRYITRNIHVTLFIVIALLGILPGLHWYYLHGGWSNRFVQHFFPKLFVLYLILGVGTFAYLTKFPERFFPGYFDFLFASHQIWHVSSLGAFIWWYQNGVELLQYRLSHPCNNLSK